MADSSNIDYSELYQLYLEEKERRRQEEERRRQAEEQQRQAEEQRRQEEERRVHAEEQQRHEQQRRVHAEEQQRYEEQRRVQAEERNRFTTFDELIRYTHNFLSRTFTIAPPSRCTTGKITAPIGKKCPFRLRPWEGCQTQLEDIYRSICEYFRSTQETAPRLFSPLIVLEVGGRNVRKRPISSEQDLETYERTTVEDYVRDIIAELCKMPAARNEYNLGQGVRFDNHANSLDQAEQASKSRPSKPDQFCIHRVDKDTSSLLTTVEYKPPHKLSVECLRRGLRPMELYEEVARSRHTPTTEDEKSAVITASVLVQEYHVMLQEGLEYSYVTNGIALVLLRVPFEDPGTLYYHLCEPNLEVNPEDEQSFLRPSTAIARVLCLCLMSFRSGLRDQQWRYVAQHNAPEWESSYDRISFSEDGSQQNTESPNDTPHDAPNSENRNPSPESSESGSVYHPPSSSESDSPTNEQHRVTLRPRSHSDSPTNEQQRVTPRPRRGEACSPPSELPSREDPSNSETDLGAPGKRGFAATHSSPTSRRVRQATSSQVSKGRHDQHNTRFCTQRCLLSLQHGGLLDDACPNVLLHKRGTNCKRHAINAKRLLQRVKKQLDENIDRYCTPMGLCGASGAPFKVTYAKYGYTVVGKGTTTRHWPELLREAEVYHILRQAQGSAVPVFLGEIDLAKFYFLHGAGEIRHMLLMGWGGDSTFGIEYQEGLKREVERSEKEIRSLGVLHKDLRPDNILWNDELQRAMIIDFHLVKLLRPKKKRISSSRGADAHQRKRLRTIAHEYHTSQEHPGSRIKELT